MSSVRESMRLLWKKRLLQDGCNAAIVFACRLTHRMLKVARLRPMQPTELPEEYVSYAAQARQGLDGASLLKLTKLAERARFSGKTFGKQAVAEAMDCILAQYAALKNCLPWPRKALLWLCFPLPQPRGKKTARRKRRA